MVDATCRICGMRFPAPRANCVICSLECRRAASREASRNYVRRNSATYGMEKQERTIVCVGCGVAFEGVFGNRRKFCNEQCRHLYNDRRRSTAQAAAGPERATCSSCGCDVPGKATVARKCNQCKKDARGDRKEYERRRSLAKYGLTPEQFDAMLNSQGGRCAICRTASPGQKGFAVDHCHVKGHVRSLLCHRCNTMIGMADEDPRILIAAMRYIGVKVPAVAWMDTPRESRWGADAPIELAQVSESDDPQLCLAI